jgi:hypothetical protein
MALWLLLLNLPRLLVAMGDGLNPEVGLNWGGLDPGVGLDSGVGLDPGLEFYGLRAFHTFIETHGRTYTNRWEALIMESSEDSIDFIWTLKAMSRRVCCREEYKLHYRTFRRPPARRQKAPNTAGFLGPTNPPWPPTWNMSMSTITMVRTLLHILLIPLTPSSQQCNSTGWSSPSRGATFGITSYDWSNAKSEWAAARPMDCEERLLHQARMTSAINRDARTFVYRNIVKALPWFSSVRRILDDPAYDGFFLKFDQARRPFHVPDCAAENSSVCSVFYHDQEQTPEVPTIDEPHPDGNCSGRCDCGAQPCGEYLFDHRNGSQLREWILEHHIGGPTGVDSPHISGLFLDDFWCSDKICAADPSVAGCPCNNPAQGPTEVDPNSQHDIGLSDKDIADITREWNMTMGAVQRRILASGSYTWSLIAGQTNANAMPVLLTNTTCEQQLRRACTPGFGAVPRIFGIHPSLDQADQDVAFFLLARGNYAWLGYGTWGMTWPFNPEPAHGGLPPSPEGLPRPAAMDGDYGEPLGGEQGVCRTLGTGRFSRRLTKATVTLDCAAFEATFDMNIV